MAVDTDLLVQIARDLRDLDRRRDALLAELARIAGGGNGAAAPAPRRRGRPPLPESEPPRWLRLSHRYKTGPQAPEGADDRHRRAAGRR